MRTPPSLGFVLAIFTAACGPDGPCGDGREALLGGASACVYEAPIVVEGGFRCPAGLPSRWDLEGASVCGPVGFRPGDVTDDECAAAGILCVPSTPGPRPALAACTVGPTWAECGGAGGPTLACRPVGGQCLWFAGDVADGFEPTRCPAEDACCVMGYPYGDAWHTPGGSAFSTEAFLYGWGSRPWDRTRERSVDVALAPLAPSAPTMTCDATPTFRPEAGPCTPAVGVTRTWNEDVLTLTARSSSVVILFWQLSIEVIRDGDGTLAARVCRVETTDVSTFSCRDVDPLCATSGTLTLDAFPASATAAESARIDLSVSFADGTTIDAVL